eukprot:15416416-Alexandrium_andersonii.AAC.1
MPVAGAAAARVPATASTGAPVAATALWQGCAVGGTGVGVGAAAALPVAWTFACNASWRACPSCEVLHPRCWGAATSLRNNCATLA